MKITNTVLLREKAIDFLKNQKQICVENLKIVAEKIQKYFVQYHSEVFFAATLLLSYYLAPAKALKYLAYWGYSLKSSFVQGTALAGVSLALANIFELKAITKAANTRINYLLGVVNVCSSYINPTEALVINIMIMGAVFAKDVYRNVFSFKDKKAFILMPRQIDIH